MVCLGLKPGVAGWKTQMNPLSFGGTPINRFCEDLWLKFVGECSINIEDFFLKTLQP